MNANNRWLWRALLILGLQLVLFCLVARSNTRNPIGFFQHSTLVELRHPTITTRGSWYVVKSNYQPLFIKNNMTYIDESGTPIFVNQEALALLIGKYPSCIVRISGNTIVQFLYQV